MRRPRMLAGLGVLVVALAASSIVGVSGGRVQATASVQPMRLAAASSVATPSLPADCMPSTTAPPFEFGTLIQIGHPAGFDQAIPDGSLTAGPVSVNGIAGSACGIVKVVSGTNGCVAEQQITIPADGQHFNTLTAVLSVNPSEPARVPFHVIPQAITATIGCGSSVSGLAVDTTAALEGSTGLFGIGCVVGPAVAHLSGVFNSPTQSLSDLEGTLAGPLQLPTANISRTCPSYIASNLDQLAGLPRQGQVTLPTRVAIYLPGSAP